VRVQLAASPIRYVGLRNPPCKDRKRADKEIFSIAGVNVRLEAAAPSEFPCAMSEIFGAGE
jgi:hypothetical protein